MPERAPHPPPVEQAAISAALHTDSSTTTDLAFGRGHRFELNDHQVSLEVFPEHQASRITTPTSRIELFTAPPPQVVDRQVILRDTGHEDVRLAVDPEGRVIFCYVYSPPLPAKLPQPDQPPSPAAPAPLRDTSSASAALPAETETPPPPAATPTGARVPTGRTAGTPEHDQAPRVQLTGRLGRDPSFRTSPRGTLIGRFPLAVHRDDGTTVWRSVLAFGSRAEQLQHRSDAGELTKGQEVSLIGYQHTREQPTRDGHTKKVTEIYAVAVTRRQGGGAGKRPATAAFLLAYFWAA